MIKIRKKIIVKKRPEKINRSQPELTFQTRKNHEAKFSINKILRAKIEQKIIIKVIQNKTNSNQMNDDQIWYKNQNDEIEKKNQFKKGFKTKLIEIKTLRIKYDTKIKWQDNIQSWRASLNSQEEEREKKKGKKKESLTPCIGPDGRARHKAFNITIETNA